MVKFTEAKHKWVAAWGWRKKRMRSWCLLGEVSVEEDENVLEVGGDWVTCHGTLCVKLVKTVDFTLQIFYKEKRDFLPRFTS